jgi:ketosteroid isomerase-like protein
LLASIYDADANWENPFGVRLHGAREIHDVVVELFARPGYRAAKDASPPRIQAIRMLGPDAAVVWSEESSTGQTEDGKPLGDRHSHYLQVVRRTSAGWKITDDMIMDERSIR